MNEEQIEQMIQDAGKTAPRITPKTIDDNIASVHYFPAYEAVTAGLSTKASAACSITNLLPCTTMQESCATVSAFGAKAMTEQKATSLEIRCLDGVAICDVIEIPEGRQANVYLAPNGGASICAIFPGDSDNDSIEAALKEVLDSSKLEADKDITALVRGSLLAFTIPRPSIKAQRQPE